MRLWIRGGRLIDPASNTDQISDIFISDGRIAGVGGISAEFQAEQIINAEGCIVAPGFIDLCNRPHINGIASIAAEQKASAASGITQFACPPDSGPLLNSPSNVQKLLRNNQPSNGRLAGTTVLPVGALLHQLDSNQLSDMSTLARSGCVALGLGDAKLPPPDVLRRAFEYAAGQSLPIIVQPCDPALAANGCVHEGPVATRLGLAGIPAIAETSALAQLLALAENTGAKLHLSRLSSAASLDLLQLAHHRGLNISADVAINNLLYSTEELLNYRSNFHVQPPLRERADRDALRNAVAEGLINAICYNHSPRHSDEKLAPLPMTEAGMSTADSFLHNLKQLSDSDSLNWPQLIRSCSYNPAQLLGLANGSLQIGASADITVFNPQLDAGKNYYSRGLNVANPQQPRLVSQLTLFQGQVIYSPE